MVIEEVLCMRTNFNEELEELRRSVIQMGKSCRESIRSTCGLLSSRNKEELDEICEKSVKISNMESLIETLCNRLLLLQQPVATDLRVISSALKMVSDMERIGDQASDIVGIVQKDSAVPAQMENTHLEKMSKATIDMVSRSVKAFVKENLGLAREVIEQDDLVDDLFSQVKKEVIEMIHNEPERGEECVAILMIAKYFERIGDHASNVAEWVEYAITGEYKGGSL